MSTLGERLRREREKLGWSQVYVSKQLGLKRSSTYANWEYDLREPDLEMINKLATLYDVSPSQLSGFNEPEVMYATVREAKEHYIVDGTLKLAEDINNLPEQKRKILMDMLEALKEDNKK